MQSSMKLCALVVALTATSTNAFIPAAGPLTVSPISSTQLYAKGFGAPPPEKRGKSDGQIDREKKSSKYDDIAASGGQEYRIFVRQFGSDDKSWLPTGSIAVPRGAQVSDAVFSNEEGLRSAIVRTYPGLKGSEMEFEYGYNLKIYPDDPVQVASKTLGGPTSGPSVGNWISNLLSPIDASGVAPPPINEEN